MFRNRTILMCIAILSVVFYHLALRGIPIGRLNIGYVGVDIFMLLSGYGIGKSLMKNSVGQFYKNRIRRILPLWLLMILFNSLIRIFNTGADILSTINNFLCDFSTLSFYINPNSLPEWYLATLILFYIISPAYKFLIEKTGWILLITISVIIFIYYITIGTTTWQYACAIPRLPLYLLGLTCAIKNKEDISYYITIPLFVLGTYYFCQNNHYIFSSCCILLCIQIANKIIDNTNFFNKSLIHWIGSHTLEIYVGNTLSAIIFVYCVPSYINILLKIFYDLLFTIALSIILCKINSTIQKVYE